MSVAMIARLSPGDGGFVERLGQEYPLRPNRTTNTSKLQGYGVRGGPPISPPYLSQLRE